MTPLHTFLSAATTLSRRPFYYWSTVDQKSLPSATSKAVADLKKTLEKSQLTDTLAYKTVLAVGATINKEKITDLPFIQNLSGLIEIYQHAPTNTASEQIIKDLSSATGNAKRSLLAYYLALEALNNKKKKLTAEQIEKSDRDIIQKRGVFYVLEYTLQVLLELTRISDNDKQKLLNAGLKTVAGNLPAYLPLEDTFRNELCLAIYDEKLRERLLAAFYNFEEVLYTNIREWHALFDALKNFNLALLNAFKDKGLRKFTAVAYAPFGDNIGIAELIDQVEKINF